jgi:hypothetical protein
MRRIELLAKARYPKRANQEGLEKMASKALSYKEIQINSDIYYLKKTDETCYLGLCSFPVLFDAC